MDINYLNLQAQYDKIYAYFKHTTEPFDFLEWDGKLLRVWWREILIENYSYEDLKKLILL